MLIFSKDGVDKLRAITFSTVYLELLGDVQEYVDELSIILTKVSYITSDNKAHLLGKNGIGNVEAMKKDTIEVSKIFEYFGVTLVADGVPKESVGARNMGFCYSTALGEAVLLNTVTNRYTFNDGSSVDKPLLDNVIPLKKEYFPQYMPDIALAQKKAEKSHQAKLKKLGLVGLTIGMSVRVKNYTELVAKYGEQALVISADDLPSLVDSTDDADALLLVKGLGYAKLSADYYNDKVGVLTAIDTATGNITIDIDGATVHDKFVEDGSVHSNPSDPIFFKLEHIALVEPTL